MKKIKAIDLFSGCGGVSCGLTHAGFDVRCAVENDKDAVNIYKGYMPLQNSTVIDRDIRTVSGKEILHSGKIERDELYLLAGCPPCQNFSFQNRYGKNKGKEERQELLFHFLRLIKELFPPFILMENVPGIKSKLNKDILDEFLEKLENKNGDNRSRYHVVFDVLNAADYGVPQSRKRFVLHAIRYDLYKLLLENGIEFVLPRATHNKMAEGGLKAWVTVAETIMDLPPIKQGELFQSEKILNHKAAGLSDINIKRIQEIRKAGGCRKFLPDNLKLKCHNNGYTGHQDVYGIMRLDSSAPTMTGGCLSYSKGRFGHPTQDRAISIREAARIQTFPDDFKFSDSVTKSSLQIGNAVPVKLVEASGQKIMEYIKLLTKSNK